MVVGPVIKTERCNPRVKVETFTDLEGMLCSEKTDARGRFKVQYAPASGGLSMSDVEERTTHRATLDQATNFEGLKSNQRLQKSDKIRGEITWPEEHEHQKAGSGPAFRGVSSS